MLARDDMGKQVKRMTRQRLAAANLKPVALDRRVSLDPLREGRRRKEERLERRGVSVRCWGWLISLTWDPVSPSSSLALNVERDKQHETKRRVCVRGRA
jgi:hypothetical protein